MRRRQNLRSRTKSHSGPRRSQKKRSTPFARRVYALVSRVPRGKVVTYGQVAGLLGRPLAARAVGHALRALPAPLLGLVPWQRVVNAAGRISHRDMFWPEFQRDLLEKEGIRFDRLGALNLGSTRWQPSNPTGAIGSDPPVSRPPRRSRKRRLH